MIKRILLVLFIVLTWISIVKASPFLACDPNPDHTWYEITGLPVPLNTKDNTKLTPTSKALCEDSKPCTLIIDLETLPSNVATPLKLQVRACNIRGCSINVPFDYTLPALPSIPVLLKLTK